MLSEIWKMWIDKRKLFHISSSQRKLLLKPTDVMLTVNYTLCVLIQLLVYFNNKKTGDWFSFVRSKNLVSILLWSGQVAFKWNVLLCFCCAFCNYSNQIIAAQEKYIYTYVTNSLITLSVSTGIGALGSWALHWTLHWFVFIFGYFLFFVLIGIRRYSVRFRFDFSGSIFAHTKLR